MIIAKKSLGQNFLTNRGIVDKIIQAAEILPTDFILEVGPGTGILTREIAKRAKKVLAVEKDRRLIADLEKEFSGTNIQIAEGDILDFDIRNYLGFGISDLEFPDAMHR